MKVKFFESGPLFSINEEPYAYADHVSISIPDIEDIEDVYNAIKDATNVFIYSDDNKLLSVYSGLKFGALSVINGTEIYSIQFMRSKELDDIANRITSLENIDYNAVNPVTFTTPLFGKGTSVYFDSRIKDGMIVIKIIDTSTGHEITNISTKASNGQVIFVTDEDVTYGNIEVTLI